jgi:PAS domain S-box-containing protein
MHPAMVNDLSIVLDVLPFAVIKVDPQWLIVYMNPAAAKALKVQRREVSGEHFWRTCKEFPADIVQQACSSSESSVRLEYQRKGQWKCIDIRIVDGGSRVIHITDRTEVYESRKQLRDEIEKREAAERELDAKQEFLQAVLDNVETGIVACDEAGALKLFNNATRAFHGVAETVSRPEEWPNIYSLYYPDGVTPLRTKDIPLFRAFSGEVVERAEMVIAPPNGPRRTVLASGHALITRDGRKLGAVVAMHDITHRKLFAQRIRQALQQFRALFNEAPIAYHEMDVHGVICKVNLAECRLLGRSRNDMVGRPVWDFVPVGDQENVRIAVSESLAGRSPVEAVEREFVTGTGKRLVVEVYENVIRDSSGEITGVRTAMLDITDRKHRARQAQALAHERAARAQAEATSAEIRAVLERIGDAYIAFDTEWRYTYVNSKAAELALKPASELLGRSVWDEFPTAIHTPFYSELQRSMREQVPVEFENYYAPLGKYFENSVYPSPSGVGVFYRDITQRVRTQRALEERTRELAAKNAELETFASVASHDLQEPLRMIGGYAALLFKRYSDALDKDAKEFLTFMIGGVDRMHRLIKDLLALCRLDQTTDVGIAKVNLGAVVELAKSNLELAIEDTAGAVTCQNAVIVRFNETRLLQLMQNLIANALKYRGAAEPVITIDAEREKDAWTIAVRDNGMGFDMRYAEQIFQPFKRLQRDEDHGTGIGLAICRKIVESRGGQIWAESTPGIGTTFYFTIPDALPSEKD